MHAEEDPLPDFLGLTECALGQCQDTSVKSCLCPRTVRSVTCATSFTLEGGTDLDFESYLRRNEMGVTWAVVCVCVFTVYLCRLRQQAEKELSQERCLRLSKRKKVGRKHAQLINPGQNQLDDQFNQQSASPI